jgi:hypothetical protein
LQAGFCFCYEKRTSLPKTLRPAYKFSEDNHVSDRKWSWNHASGTNRNQC